MRTLAALILLALLTRPVSADDVNLSLLLASGKSWKVEQTIELKCTARPKVKSGGATISVPTREPYVLQEKFTDACTKDDGGKPLEVRRTYTSSKLSAAKKPAGATTLEACVLLLTATGDACTAKAEKGKPDPMCLELLGQGPIDPATILLPGAPVAVGGEWEVACLRGQAMPRISCAGVGGAKGPARADLPNVLKDLKGDSGFVAGDIPEVLKKAGVKPGESTPTAGSIVFHCRLESATEGVARIRCSGKLDTGNLGIPPPPNVPLSSTTVEGTMTFQLAEHPPVKLEWKVTTKFEDKPMEGMGAAIPGYTEEWMLTRTYAAR